MKQLQHLILILVGLWAAQPAMAQSETSKYLEGAVPELEGKVVFAQTIHIPQASKEEIYAQVEAWMKKRFNNASNRVVYQNPEKGQVVSLGNDTLVFKSSFLSLDQAAMSYQVIAEAKDAECDIQIDRISYAYEENKNYAAEELITDKVALNKSKTKMYKGFSKWRIHTVDYMNNLLDELTQHLYQLKKGQTTQQTQVSVVSTTTSSSQASETTVQQDSSIQTQTATATPQGFAQVSVNKLPQHLLQWVESGEVLLSIKTGDQVVHIPNQEIQVGRAFGKPVLTVLTTYGSELYKALETNKNFTISFFTEAHKTEISKLNLSKLTPIATSSQGQSFAEAEFVVECKGILAQSITPEAISDLNLRNELGSRALSKVYLSEITAIWIK